MKIKKLSARGMKIMKSLHIIFAVLWMVGVVAMILVLQIGSGSGDELYMNLKVVRILDDLLVIPFAMLTVLTAIIYGIWSNWGFFKHRWITVKWIVSMFVIIVGTFILDPIHNKNLIATDQLRDAALNSIEIADRTTIVTITGSISIILLLSLIIISVFKPWKGRKAKPKHNS